MFLELYCIDNIRFDFCVDKPIVSDRFGMACGFRVYLERFVNIHT